MKISKWHRYIMPAHCIFEESSVTGEQMGVMESQMAITSEFTVINVRAEMNKQTDGQTNS